MLLYQVLAYTMHGIKRFKISAPTWNEKFEWIPWWIIFYIRYSRIFWIYIKKPAEKTIDPSIIIYINKTENKTTIKIDTWCYLGLLTIETVELLGSTEGRITKMWKYASFRYYWSSMVHCNIVNNSYQKYSKVLYPFFSNKSFVIAISKNFWLRIFIYWTMVCWSKL